METILKYPAAFLTLCLMKHYKRYPNKQEIDSTELSKIASEYINLLIQGNNQLSIYSQPRSQPNYYSQQSNYYSQQPNYYSQQPNRYSQQPNRYSQQPNYYSQQPNYYSQQPNYYSQQPNYYSQPLFFL